MKFVLLNEVMYSGFIDGDDLRSLGLSSKANSPMDNKFDVPKSIDVVLLFELRLVNSRILRDREDFL